MAVTYNYGTGRRKTAVARVFIKPGTGNIVVNGKPVDVSPMGAAARESAFIQSYRAELAQRTDLLRLLDELRRRGQVTLLYGARDTTGNNAVVLREVLEERGFSGKPARKSTGRGRTKASSATGGNDVA